MSLPGPDAHLDVRGVACPANTAKILVKIATMSEGEILEVLLDDGEPMVNVPPVLLEEGHEIVSDRVLEDRSHSLLIRVGS